MSILNPLFKYLRLLKCLIFLMTLLNKCLCPESAVIIIFYNNLWLQIWFKTIISFKYVRWMFNLFSFMIKCFIIYTKDHIIRTIWYGPCYMNHIIWTIWYGPWLDSKWLTLFCTLWVARDGLSNKKIPFIGIPFSWNSISRDSDCRMYKSD